MWPCRKTVSSDGVMADLSESQRLGKDTRGDSGPHTVDFTICGKE